jgi:hypothetical protein
MTEQSWRLLPQCLSGLGIILILLLSHKFWIARDISCTRHSRRVPESTNLQVSTTRWTMENEKFAACGRKFNLFANYHSKKFRTTMEVDSSIPTTRTSMARTTTFPQSLWPNISKIIMLIHRYYRFIDTDTASKNLILFTSYTQMSGSTKL